MSYDPLKLCKEVNGQYEVDPAVMFPATVERIKEVLEGAAPVEIVSPGWSGRADREPVADSFLKQAERLPAGAWVAALVPYNPDKPDEARSEALGLAESWFKRALVLAVGKAVRLHISKNLDYRR